MLGWLLLPPGLGCLLGSQMLLVLAVGGVKGASIPDSVG